MIKDTIMQQQTLMDELGVILDAGRRNFSAR
jgi:hypothetical protein